jgi:hypothetical protein
LRRVICRTRRSLIAGGDSPLSTHLRSAANSVLPDLTIRRNRFDSFYRFYGDSANDASGFNQLQRGAGPGAGGWNPFSNRGDVGLIAFADGRLATWANLSANIGYIYNSSVKAIFREGMMLFCLIAETS